MNLTLKSPAKVNLTLDILGYDDKNGHHFVQTIMHEVPELSDELRFELADELSLSCEHPDLPTDETNTIIKAARLLQKHTKTSKGAHITLSKNIPLSSGLGGPSSNAATTLKALNQLWELNLSDWTLRNLAAQIGMDVPFFITGGCAIGMHYGEQLEHLPTLDQFGFEIEIIETGVAVSTANAYATLNLSQCGKRNRDTGRLVTLLKEKEKPTDPKEIEGLLHNDFEFDFFAEYSDLQKKILSTHLSGSGGALFKLRSI
jgi:4-diphosphocytidyl-2-C-methyl-D-erythritol kinase